MGYRRRALWEWPLVAMFGRDFRRIPRGLLLDPMLSGHARGNLLDGMRHRRETLPPWLACVGTGLALANLAVVWPAARRATTLPFIGAGALVAVGWSHVFGQQIMEDNALISLAVLQAEEHVQSVRARHEQAVRILSRREQEPFVLMLRSFDEVFERRKGSDAIPHGSPGAVEVLRSFRPDTRAEEKLAERLSRWFPVVAVHNPSDDYPEQRTDIARLFVPEDEDWRAVIRRLVTLAGYICVHVTQLTPGVTAELEAILDADRAGSTAVILCDLPDDEDGMRDTVYKFFRGVGYDAPDPVPARRTDAPLDRFRQVVSQQAIDYGALDRCSPFAGWITAKGERVLLVS